MSSSLTPQTEFSQVELTAPAEPSESSTTLRDLIAKEGVVLAPHATDANNTDDTTMAPVAAMAVPPLPAPTSDFGSGGDVHVSSSAPVSSTGHQASTGASSAARMTEAALGLKVEPLSVMVKREKDSKMQDGKRRREGGRSSGGGDGFAKLASMGLGLKPILVAPSAPMSISASSTPSASAVATSSPAQLSAVPLSSLSSSVKREPVSGLSVASSSDRSFTAKEIKREGEAAAADADQDDAIVKREPSPEAAANTNPLLPYYNTSTSTDNFADVNVTVAPDVDSTVFRPAGVVKRRRGDDDDDDDDDNDGLGDIDLDNVDFGEEDEDDFAAGDGDQNPEMTDIEARYAHAPTFDDDGGDGSGLHDDAQQGQQQLLTDDAIDVDGHVSAVPGPGHVHDAALSSQHFGNINVDIAGIGPTDGGDLAVPHAGAAAPRRRGRPPKSARVDGAAAASGAAPPRARAAKKPSGVQAGQAAAATGPDSGALAFPPQRMKRLLQSVSGARSVSDDAALAAAIATELFLADLVQHMDKKAERHGPRPLTHSDVADAAVLGDRFAFLQEEIRQA